MLYYSRGFEFVIVSYRTVSVLFTVPFFTAIATGAVPFFSLTVRSVKRTEPLILTVRFLVFDREQYRTKMNTVNRLILRTANRIAPKGGPLSVYIWGTRTTPRSVPLRIRVRGAYRTVLIYNVYLYTEPILRTRYGTVTNSDPLL